MDFLQSFWVLCAAFSLVDWRFVYAQIECPNVKIDNGSAKKKSKGRLIEFKCKLSFELVGVKFAVCPSSGIWSQQIPSCVGTTCQRPADPQNSSVEVLHKGGVLRYTCGAGLTRLGAESLTCNGTKWSDDPPKCIEGQTTGCDFEQEDLCGWSQDNTDDFDWTRTKGETPTANTGPRYDHTINSPEGHYLFMESSAPKKENQKVRLISPPFLPNKTENVCLEFFYHMFGPDGDGEVGNLDVYVKPQTMQTTLLKATNNIFHLGGNQGDQWLRADPEIPKQKEPFNVVIQATKLKSWTGDISIDDVKLITCPAKSTKTTITTSKDAVEDSMNISASISPKSQTSRKPTRRPTTTAAASATRLQKPSLPAVKSLATATTNPALTTTTKSKSASIKPKNSQPTKPTTSTKSSLLNNIDTSTTSSYRSRLPVSQTPTQRYESLSTSMTRKETISFIVTSSYPVTDANHSDDDETVYNSNANNDNKNRNGKSDKDSESDYVDYDAKVIEPDSNLNRNNSSISNDSLVPFIDYDQNKEDKIGGINSSFDEDEEIADGLIADTGAVKDGPISHGRIALIPLVVGIVASVVVGVTVVAILAWLWVRSQQQKEEKSDEDQMNIITEYVETNLNA